MIRKYGGLVVVKKLLLPVLALLVTVSVSNAAINLVWGSNMGIYQEGGAIGNMDDLLPIGSIVQLIHAGGDGVANDLDAGSPDLVGGDDMVLDTLTVGLEIGGIMRPGVFKSGGGVGIVYDSVGATDTLFIRAFNSMDLAAFAAAGGYYGNSPLQSGWNTELEGELPPLPDNLFWDGPDTQGDIINIYFAGGGGSVIPEPSTVMLALAGALMILRKLRK
jgi:hypothetical protein